MASVLVTGASSGIGLETALYLAEKGWQVTATMRDLRRRALLDTEAQRRHVHLSVLPMDVTDPSGVRGAVQTMVAKTGSIDALVNNAGVQIRGYFEDLSDAEIRSQFEVNLFGAMTVTRTVLPYMRAAGRGRIVLMSSLAGRMGAMAQSAYSATKFALEGYGESLSLELASLGISVSLVEPGIVNTGLWSKDHALAAQALASSSPYRQRFDRTEQLTDRLIQDSRISSLDVARTVDKALTAHRPRLRYIVGRRAGYLVTLRRYVPEALFDGLYYRIAAGDIRR